MIHENVFLLNLDSSELDTPVYRFISFDSLLELIISGKLTLVSTSLWDDLYENYFFKTKVSTPNGDFSGSLNEIQTRLYGQCWTLNPESDALWRIYSENHRGVRIQTTLRKLYEAVAQIDFFQVDNSACMGKVEYNTLEEIEHKIRNVKYFTVMDSKFFYNTLLTKRNEFLHEREVRVLYCASKVLNSSIREFNIRPDDFIGSITLDPRISNRFEAVYLETLRRVGYKNIIKKSDLYRFNRLDIKLI